MTTARLLFSLAFLKRLPRTGWLRAGVHPSLAETVAEHSWGTSIIAVILALSEEEDPGRCVLLASLHDLPEEVSGDPSPIQVALLRNLGISKGALDEEAASMQLEDLPGPLASFFRDALSEYRNGQSASSRMARDANVLDRGIQALLYRKQGYSTEGISEEVAGLLQTRSARDLWVSVQEAAS